MLNTLVRRPLTSRPGIQNTHLRILTRWLQYTAGEVKSQPIPNMPEKRVPGSFKPHGL
jgi:hypothetical protein